MRQTPEPHDYSILVKKGKFTLFLLDHGEPVAQWPVALGKNPGQKQVSGDMKTPEEPSQWMKSSMLQLVP